MTNKESKDKYVNKMFDKAARRYDLLNDVLSYGLHRQWKRKAVKEANIKSGSTVIDLCAGTLDISILLAKIITIKGQVVALDFSKEMLEIGEKKAEKKGLIKQIETKVSDVTNIDFPNNTFNAATIGFGLRNVANIEKVLREMLRVIIPGSKSVILEFSTPVNKTWRKLYDSYSYSVLPHIGKIISDSEDGYSYLPDSIRKFPKQEELKQTMERVGFINVTYENLLGGIVAIHAGEKQRVRCRV